jgi:hypothetical protein
MKVIVMGKKNATIHFDVNYWKKAFTLLAI